MDTSAYSDPLAIWLGARLSDWEQARKPQEEKLLECYQDVMRIPREDDTRGTGTAKSKKAKSLFIGSTRNKVRASRAKIVDALFGAGKLPFDTEPTNEQLAPFADALEDIIAEQLRRGGFKRNLQTGVNTLAMYGTGFMFGPFVKKEVITETTVDESQGFPMLVESKFEFDVPYYDVANTLDVYPDPDAMNAKDGAGMFWVSHLSPHTVAAWARDPAYSNITEALVCVETTPDSSGSDRAEQYRANIQSWAKGGRIKVARFFGLVPRSFVEDPEPPVTVEGEATDAVADPESQQPDGQDLTDYIEAVIVMAGGVVVKKDLSPYEHRPTERCLYESVDHEMWGVGVAENNAPHQKTVNAAFRLFMDGKGMALLGTRAVDRSKFMPTEDFKKYPGKVYQFKPNLTPEEKKGAITEFVEADITGGWLDVIRMSEQFSDDDTGITKYTQGDDSRNLNKTASGISMIMNASSLPIKEVLQNIDEMWIEPMIEAIVAWNLKYLEVDTVAKLHGPKIAEIWKAIKEFGKTSFINIKATGAQTFVQKEILAQKLQNFLSMVMGNPATAALVDPRELLNQVWDAMQMGKESPILKDEDEANGQAGGAKLQQATQQIEQMTAAMQQMQQQLAEAKSGNAVALAKLESDKFIANIRAESSEQVAEMKAVTDILLKKMDQGFSVLASAAEARVAVDVADSASEPAALAPPVDSMQPQL